MKRFSSALVLGAAALAIVSSAACGDDSASSSAGGGGAGATSTTSTSTSTSSSPTTSTSSSGDGGSTTTSSSNGGGGPTTTTTTTTGSGGSGGGQVLPGDFDCTDPSGELPSIVAQEVFTVSGVPLQMKQAPGDNDTVYVGLKDGRIVIVRDGAELPTPFLDVSDLVNDQGEQGFLGFAFHPDYATNGRFFVHYSANNGDTHIAEYAVSADPNVANPDEVGLVVDAPAYQQNHNGGAIEVGPDGALWISIGDGGGSNDEGCFAQNLDSRAGKILRADISTPGAYGPASGNFPGADEFVFNIGLRNPWRMSFDGCNGNLWIGDVGQGAWEEVDVQPAGSPPQNFGWSSREGAHDFDSGCPSQPEPYVEPILDYSHAEGISITGGYVYRGSSIPALRGAYVFGDYGSGRVWLTRYQPGDATPVAKTELTGAAQGGNLVAFGQDNLGEVYILNAGGSIRQLVAQ